VTVSDALELLSKHFTHHVVRDYAVSRLQDSSNEELLHYLLQLVQALRYESEESQESKLAEFIFQKSMEDFNIRNFMYWYLKVECEDPKYGSFYLKKFTEFKTRLMSRENDGLLGISALLQSDDTLKELTQVDKEMRQIRNRKEKLQKFHDVMQATGSHGTLADFKRKLPLPLDPNVITYGIEPITIFTSSAEPLMIKFKAANRDDGYLVIYKNGDDLRQDQIIVQLISLMDELLRKESLDLKMTPYKVLATSTKEGMLQCVRDCSPITKILAEHNGDILNFLKQHNPSPESPLGISPQALDTFVRSCAGYCVVTFILCVGDRHLDNLLITTSGHLFHIDFGFIGRDPKLYPPPMKLCSEMVDAMGGENGKDFVYFKQFCVEAYNILRKNANLILNLVSLMTDANIQDFANQKALLQIQEKFQLDKNDEEAGRNLQELMQASVTALFPRFTEKIHKWKQYWDNR